MSNMKQSFTSLHMRTQTESAVDGFGTLFSVLPKLLNTSHNGLRHKTSKTRRYIWESGTQTAVHLQPAVHRCSCELEAFLRAPEVTQILREVCSYNFTSVLMCSMINHIYLSKHFSHLLSFFNYFHSVLGGFHWDNLSLKSPGFYLPPVRGAGSTQQVLEKNLAIPHETLSNT